MGSRRRIALLERATTAAFRSAVRLKAFIRGNPRLNALFYRAVNRDAYGPLYIHDLMLADQVRLSAYADAIAANVNPGDAVLDLGTGTGILAILAERQAPATVYAIDHAPIPLARRLAEANGCRRIRFEQVHSAHFDPGEPLNVIIHEQIGARIFGERMVTNVVALRDRVLERGGRILPNRFDVYLEPVELREEEIVPLIWEHRFEGVDFSSIRESAPAEGDYPRPDHLRSDGFRRLLCEPAPAFSFDLEQDRLDDLPRKISYRREAAVAGTQHGFALYFVAHFDDDHSLTNAPLQPATHWPTALLRTESRERRSGEVIEFEFTADDLELPETWRWTL